MKMYFKIIQLCFLCLLSFKGINTDKVYLIDFPNAEDTALLNNYDDYDPINEFVDDDDGFTITPSNKYDNLIQVTPLKLSQPKEFIKKKDTPKKCHRIYGSIYGNNKYHTACKENLRRYNQRPRFYIRNRSPEFYQVNEFPEYDKMDTGFSQDYLDVRDLGRTDAPESADYREHLVNKEFRGLSEVPCDPSDLIELEEITRPDCLTYNSGYMFPYRV